MKPAIIAISLLGLLYLASAAPPFPVWAKKYTLSATFRVPYFNTHVPTHVVYDSVAKKEKVAYYHGLDSFIFRFDMSKVFSVYPKVDKQLCGTDDLGVGDQLIDFLPTIDKKWSFEGTLEGKHVWKWVNETYGFTNVYKMHVHKHNNHPHKLHIHGWNFVTGSHPDEYVIDYHEYHPDKVDETAFMPPSICKQAIADPNLHSRTKAIASFMGAGLISHANNEVPSVDVTSDRFHQFVAMNKKVYSSLDEYRYRRNIFENNLRMIEEHNANPENTYTLGITKFADMELDEIHRVYIPNHFKKGIYSTGPVADIAHIPSGKALPTSVNWVTKGKVNPPKDQGACGSCWTFGTAGTLEGAWAIKTGKLLSLSEQNILDCAWLKYDTGCNGGLASEALAWVKQNGIATEHDYKYLMMDGYCQKGKKKSEVVITGFANVTNEQQLMDAVAKGPVTVAINASLRDFYFYQKGIYSNPRCANGPHDLDHEVLVVGYGTENGQDYWLLKNSWGKIWGEQGYFRFKKNVNQCGLSNAGHYPLV